MRGQKIKREDGERGSTLFLILIAVVLFAAVSFAVTNSRGGSGTTEKEKAALVASEIIQYAALIENAVTRALVTNKCSDTQISFENTLIAGYANASAPADKSCHVFDPAGGGLTPQRPPSAALDGVNMAKSRYNEYWYMGISKIFGIGTNYVNSTDPDGKELLMIIPWLARDVCIALDKALGVPLQSGDAPITVGTHWQTWQRWDGNYGGIYGYYLYAANLSTHKKWSACLKGCPTCTTPLAGTYAFYHVLIAR